MQDGRYAAHKGNNIKNWLSPHTANCVDILGVALVIFDFAGMLLKGFDGQW